MMKQFDDDVFVQYEGILAVLLKPYFWIYSLANLHSTFLEQCRVMLHLLNHSVGIALAVLL